MGNRLFLPTMNNDLLQRVQQTILLQAESIKNLTPYINNDFLNVVTCIKESKGRVVVTGIGKSAIIAQKIVSTLNSTGTPSLFMHAADAIHGDLGMIREFDVVVVISKSGESPEIKVLIPLLKNFGNPLVAITGNTEGYLAKNVHYILNTTVQQEACPNNLAPTTSTTAQMVMGDALAIALIYTRGFKPEDFAKFHPGGNLGKRLFLKVDDIYTKENPPKVTPQQSLKEVIVEISSKFLGIAAVVDENNKAIGVITDGDLRRMLAKTNDLSSVLAKDIFSAHPKTITTDSLALDALELMRTHNISGLLVTDALHNYLGVLHIHQLVKEGII